MSDVTPVAPAGGMSSWPVLAALLRLGLVRARTVLRTGRRSRQASAPKAVLVLTAWAARQRDSRAPCPTPAQHPVGPLKLTRLPPPPAYLSRTKERTHSDVFTQ